MADFPTNPRTMLDAAYESGDNNAIVVAEVLHQTNAIYQDALWLPSNRKDAHRVRRRGNLPTGGVKVLNTGVAPERTSRIPYTEPMGMIRGFNEMDRDELDFIDDPATERSDDDIAFTEGLGQTATSHILYGTGIRQALGIQTRFNALSLDNVAGAGGTGGNLTSVYVVQWGARQAHLFYARNQESAVGVTMKDHGEQVDRDVNGGKLITITTEWRINMGLAVWDNRSIQRYCNIKTTGSSNTFNDSDLVRLLNNIPNGGAGAVIYAPKLIMDQVDILGKDKSNVDYQPGKDLFGMPITFFRGFPFRKTEQISVGETVVT